MSEIEASHVDVEAMPGAVVVKLFRDVQTERRMGLTMGRMFVEMSVSEARAHHAALGAAIARAGAMAAAAPGDVAPLL